MFYPPEDVLTICLDLMEIDRNDMTTCATDRRQHMILGRECVVAALRHFSRMSFPEIAPYMGRNPWEGPRRLMQKYEALPAFWRNTWIEAVGIRLADQPEPMLRRG